MQVFLIPSMAYGLALVLTPLIQRIALQHNWIDAPDERKIHQQPMVRLGGVAIAIALLSSLLPLFMANGRSIFSMLAESYGLGFQSLGFQGLEFYHLEFYGLLIGSLGFFLIGAIDDLYSLSPFQRLAWQALVGSLVWCLGIQLTTLPLPGLGITELGIFSLPVTLVWLAGVANAINWLDGLDGLASSVVISLELIIFGLLTLTHGSLEIRYFCLAVVGATLGFLYHNAYPAKLFMGDGGSYLLGFALGATSLLVPPTAVGGAIAILPFVLLALPILDMSRVILRRLWAGHSPFYPDRGHIHHWLLDCGFSQRETVSLVVSLSCCLSSMAIPLAGITQGWWLVLGSGLLMFLQWMGCIRKLPIHKLSRATWLSAPNLAASTAREASDSV